MFSTPENHLYASICIVASFLVLLPACQHWRAGNLGTLLMIFWCFVGTLNLGINSIAFNGSTRVTALVGCDISAVIGRIWQIGHMGATLCVLLRLEQIASTRQTNYLYGDLCCRRLIELALGLGIPLLQIPLFFVIQGHRLDVIENIGCSAPTYTSIASIFLYQAWCFALALSGLVVAVMVARWFVIRRKQFVAVLQASNSGLTQGKYIRLLALCTCEVLVMFPSNVLLPIPVLLQGLKPYESWARVHENFNSVWEWKMTTEYFSRQDIVKFEVMRWFSVLPALLFFAFFGVTQEARSQYMRNATQVYRAFASRLIKSNGENPQGENAALPQFRRRSCSAQDKT